jgi:hypothetical protein
MTGILKVDQWKDSGDNTLMTSDGAGNLTANAAFSGTLNAGIVSINNASTQGRLNVSNNGAEQLEVFPGDVANKVTLQAFNRSTSTSNSFRYFGLTHEFTTNGSERMCIQSNGNIELGTGGESISNYTTNPGNWISNENDGGEDFRVGTLVTSADASVIHIVNKTTTGSGNMMAFRVQGSTKGTISTDGSNTSYNTSSDYRLKENVVDVVDAITRVKQLQPKRFNFIEQPNKTVDGFLAHEVSSIVPEAISGTHNEVEVWKEGEELPEGVSVGDNKLDDEGNTIPVYQGIDQSKLVPLLTASLQEAIAKIEELETRLETLENA